MGFTVWGSEGFGLKALGLRLERLELWGFKVPGFRVSQKFSLGPPHGVYKSFFTVLV